MQSPRQRALLIFKMASVLALTLLRMPIGVRPESTLFFALKTPNYPHMAHVAYQILLAQTAVAQGIGTPHTEAVASRRG